MTFAAKPWQAVGVEWMWSRAVLDGSGMIFDEPGMGKSKMIIDFACEGLRDGAINSVMVVCPAYVRDEWDNMELGHIALNAWEDQRHLLHRFDAQSLSLGSTDPSALLWVVASYDFLRNEKAVLAAASQLRRRGKWLLVFDESSQLNNRTAQRTKAAAKLRKYADASFGTNGTPIANSVLDLWSQFNVVSPQALRGQKFWQFRDRWARMGGWKMKQVVGIRDEGQMWDELRPWVLLRRAKDHLNLEEPVYKILPVPMGQKAWDLYLQMKEDMVAWLDSKESSAITAGVKFARLAQLTSGFMGGVVGSCSMCDLERIDHLDEDHAFIPQVQAPIIVDDAKLAAVLQWASFRSCGVVWTRFRTEAIRTHQAMVARGLRTGLIVGGMGARRDDVKNDFKAGRVDFLVSIIQAGAMGQNLQRAHEAIYMSNESSWLNREQSERRLIRMGQEHAVVITDLIATSPNGRRTVDWTIREKLKRKEKLSNLSKEAWKTIVREL